jgi:hypothetical protein
MPVINLVVLFGFLVYVESLYRVHLPAFGCEMYGGHDSVDGAELMVVFQKVFSKI